MLFKDRVSLEASLPDLFEHAILKTACQDTLRFLGRKLHGNFKGEVTTHLKKRSEGWRAAPASTPLQNADRALFATLLSGEFALNGFRNRDLCARLYSQPAASIKETKQRCTRASRQIAKLREHGLIAKVKDARLYRITKLGSQILFAVLSY